MARQGILQSLKGFYKYLVKEFRFFPLRQSDIVEALSREIK